MILHNLLNVLVQIANKMGLQKKISNLVYDRKVDTCERRRILTGGGNCEQFHEPNPYKLIQRLKFVIFIEFSIIGSLRHFTWGRTNIQFPKQCVLYNTGRWTSLITPRSTPPPPPSNCFQTIENNDNFAEKVLIEKNLSNHISKL
jgi:hypothetical protein